MCSALLAQKGQRMKVIQVTTKDGQKFYCEEGTRVLVSKISQIARTTEVQMTKETYDAIPASNESARFFE